MKTIVILTILGFVRQISYSQTSITQGFEGGAGWIYTGGSVSTELARTGTNSIRIGRGTASCGTPNDPTDIIFDPIFINGNTCPGTGTFRFYHRTGISSGSGCGSGKGMDTREGFAVYTKLNGAVNWTLLNSFSGFNNGEWDWSSNADFVSFGGTAGNQCASLIFPNPFTYVVPGGTTSAQFKIISIRGTGSDCINFQTVRTNNLTADLGSNYDRGDEGLFIDDVSFTTSAPCILPVELLDFYGLKKSESTQLIWKVADEKNINYYTIEKSLDAINFDEVAKILPNTSLSNIKTYTANDDASSNEITYYRLSTKEKDGSTIYYKIIAIDGNLMEWDFSHYQKDENIIIDFKSSVPKQASASLYNLSGKLLAAESINNMQTKINIANTAAGIYFIRITSANKTENLKICIQK